MISLSPVKKGPYILEKLDNYCHSVPIEECYSALRSPNIFN